MLVQNSNLSSRITVLEYEHLTWLQRPFFQATFELKRLNGLWLINDCEFHLAGRCWFININVVSILCNWRIRIANIVILDGYTHFICVFSLKVHHLGFKLILMPLFLFKRDDKPEPWIKHVNRDNLPYFSFILQIKYFFVIAAPIAPLKADFFLYFI